MGKLANTIKANLVAGKPIVTIISDDQMAIGNQYLQVLVTFCTPGYRFQVTYYGVSTTAPYPLLKNLAQAMANDPLITKACNEIVGKPNGQQVAPVNESTFKCWWHICKNVTA